MHEAIYDGAAEFLQVHEYKHLRRWAETINARPAVQRGRKVNRIFGDPTRTQDKLL